MIGRLVEERIKLFKQVNDRSVKRPRRIVVDGLWAYENGFKKVFTVDAKNIELNL